HRPQHLTKMQSLSDLSAWPTKSSGCEGLMAASKSGSRSGKKKTASTPAAFTLSMNASPSPFPREKFNRFLNYFRIQSPDFKGRIPINLLGTQRYILDEVEEGLSRGITTFVILKGRQQGATTLFYLIDMFWAFEHPGLLGTFILHEESALDKWRANIDMT